MGRPPLYSKTGRTRCDSGKVGEVSRCGVRAPGIKRKGLRWEDTRRMVADAYERWLDRHPEQHRFVDSVFGSERSLRSKRNASQRARVPTQAGDLAGAFIAMGPQPRGTLKRMALANGVNPKALAMAVARERARRGMAAIRAKAAK